MVKAIIFDCFGVLASEGWIAFKWQYFKDDPEKMTQATELNRMADAALISYKDFIHAVAGMANIDPRTLDNVLKNVSADSELLDYINRELRPKYKLGILSNVGDNWLYTIFSEDDIGLFDAWELSHETGITKPDIRAYAAIAHKLGVEPNECIFIDDLAPNVAGAKDAGMQGILYKDFPTFTQELPKYLQV